MTPTSEDPTMPTLRPDWKIPTPPAEGLLPCFHIIGPSDGADFFWATEEEISADTWAEASESDDRRINDWPFIEDVCPNGSLEALGFRRVD